MVSYILVVEKGPEPGQKFTIEKEETIIGRDPACDVVVSFPEVSRRHARLYYSGSALALEDLGSTNGTFVRGQRLVSPLMVVPGDRLSLGEHVVLRLESHLKEPAAPGLAGGEETHDEDDWSLIVEEGEPGEFTAEPEFEHVPAYQAPPEPVEAGTGVVPALKRIPTWGVVALILLAFLVVFILIPWLIIDITNSYCILFPGFFNHLQPGVCP